ncbi:hypothetical protein CD187_03410 [Citrobacter youngae]|nr:hypothetical protein CD187_03410 [Citrobacter youngae]
MMNVFRLVEYFYFTGQEQREIQYEKIMKQAISHTFSVSNYRATPDLKPPFILPLMRGNIK